MKLEDIIQEWEKDSTIDKTELADESLKIPKLHHKYHQILTNEKLILHNNISNLKKLKLEKYEFFTQGHNEYTLEKGWKLPAKGMILKSDIPMYIDADDDISKLTLRINLQEEKIILLESIIKSIMNRSYNISAAIDWNRFVMGG